ncbi:MAG: hypothetical protein KDA92_23960, partial [Planctomycetales bacterium]|nr:hypothetical protein [Planctomycetales bacterium]
TNDRAHLNRQLTDWQSKLSQLDELLQVQERELADADTAVAACEAAVAAAERMIRFDLEERFAIAGLQGLSPEQLAASMISSLRLMPRLQQEALQKWTRELKDQKPEDVSDAAREAQVETNLRARLAQIENTFVNLYGNTPGSPQDVFQATVDQALHFDNDGQISSWSSPARGSLAESLLARKSADEVINELYLSLFTREPTDDELAVMKSFWESDDKKRELVRDMIWSMLASVEFRFAH